MPRLENPRGFARRLARGDRMRKKSVFIWEKSACEKAQGNVEARPNEIRRWKRGNLVNGTAAQL